MCRAKGTPEERRCPSHKEPELVEKRNEVRREQHAAKKLRDKTAMNLASKGITFSRGDAVVNEYFQLHDSFDMNRIDAVEDAAPREVDELTISLGMENSFHSKPENGGLWTSPGAIAEDGGVRTAWTTWSNEQGYKVTDAPIVPLNVRKAAVIVRIDSAKDLERLCKEFPAKGPGFSYEAMSKAGIDAVRLSESGLREAKLAPPTESIHNLSNWDIDSTVWLTTDHISAKKACKKAYHEPNHDRDDDYEYDWDDETSGGSGEPEANAEFLQWLSSQPDEPNNG